MLSIAPTYSHGEYDGDTLGTDFRNNEFNYRVAIDQKRIGRLSGNFGISGMHRDYRTLGDESLAPPTIQKTFALFALETVDYQKLSLQFGGRSEHNGYRPETGSESVLTERSFAGVSAAAGVRVPPWKVGAFVTNYVHVFAIDTFNLGDRLYYNHSSFIKNLAPEIGRGVRVSNTLRFF